jgi:hypothetical protein
MLLMEKAATKLVVVKKAKKESVTLLVDQLLLPAKKEAEESLGERKERKNETHRINVKKNDKKNYEWIKSSSRSKRDDFC